LTVYRGQSSGSVERREIAEAAPDGQRDRGLESSVSTTDNAATA
jgi:hypothetical protein